MVQKCAPRPPLSPNTKEKPKLKIIKVSKVRLVDVIKEVVS